MLDIEEIKKLYLVEHLTMQEIGKRVGCTRQNVHYLLRKNEVDISSGERFLAKCDVCGTEYSITRRRFMNQEKHFCSKSCYTSYMHNPDYRQWRDGQRMARKVMEIELERRLVPGEVIHHEDGDNMNNDISNLRLFSSNSEHMKYHHKVRRERIKATV
jgi:DNA-binding transcriptional regulator LsrR (DeoR family)